MKLNSISGVTHHVKDLEASATFYESLGFRIGKREPYQVSCYVNWFWINLVPADAAIGPAERGVGISVHAKVDDLDEFYQGVLDLKLEPSTEPNSPAKGVREFTLADPDGYALVFFEKK